MFNKLSRLVTSHVKNSNFVNASKVQFTELETAILSLGPKHVFRDTFGVPDIVSYFEKASYILEKNGENSPLVNGTLDLLKEEHIKANFANSPSKVLKNLVKKLKELPVIITKADKETKLVAMDKDDYYNGLLSLLSDESKFQRYVPPEKKRGRPSKLNPFEKASEMVKDYVDSVPNLKEKVDCPLYTRQPFLYGLAKTHKKKNPIPLRPVLSATACYNFQLAKFISKAISPFCYSKYCLQNVDEFLRRLKEFKEDLPDSASLKFCSYDVQSLFTNIPLDDTIDKLITEIFRVSDTYEFEGVMFTRDNLKEALELCAKDQLFLFKGEIWKQVDGNSMGSPLGPPLANFYVSYLENYRINFSSDISPNFYCRYVDDIFSIFIDKPDATFKFLDHLNEVSTPLKFTIEEMVDKKLNFIGLTVSEELYISIIDKGPFYNLVSSDSYVPDQYLFSSINCLSFRAISFTDESSCLNNELDKIKNSAVKVGLPLKKVVKIINRQVESHRSKTDLLGSGDNMSTNEVEIASASADVQNSFVLLPFINKKLSLKVKNFFHHLKYKVSFCTSRNLYTVLRPREPAIEGKYGVSNVVYKYKCSNCDRCYVGYTKRPINVRSSEHCVKTSVLSQAHSSFGCSTKMNKENFSILCSGRSLFDLRVKEAYLINTLKPELNTKYEKIKSAKNLEREQKRASQLH